MSPIFFYHRHRVLFLLISFLLVLAFTDAFAQTNLIANGSFELNQIHPAVPDDWAAAGNAVIKQRLALDTGRDGHHCARLECTAFNGDGPDFHAMLCQVGKIQLRSGQWYRLVFWAKAQGIRGGAVEVAISDTHHWENAGLSEAFSPTPAWKQFELLFRARMDLPAPASRLQFWFKSTGTLWLDDVSLTPSDDAQQWFPQIATEGVKNFVPNSSFECGAANWGSFTYGLSGWAGNLYRLEGDVDSSQSSHGGHSFRISLSPDHEPVFYFDYYDPVRQPVRRVLVANHGWFRVKPGQPLTLSAALKADAENTAAVLAANEAPTRLLRKQVRVGTSWQRHEFTFTPSEAFIFIAVGLDLEEAGRASGTLWVDAIQLERGAQATAYEPRSPLESFIQCAATPGSRNRTAGSEASAAAPPGNIFTNPSSGISLVLRAYNDSTQPQTSAGTLTLTNFFDQPVLTRPVQLKVPAHSAAELAFNQLCAGQQGFFRATWTPSAASRQSLRCAVIEPAPADLTDSPFGFNHAFPWDFLLQLSRQAGVFWWRDWSAKWQTVEPAKGQWDFKLADAQIRRVLDTGSQVEVLLPFPSATWSTAANPAEVEKKAGNNDYLRARLPLSCAPKQPDDFAAYAAAVARHYGQTGSPRVTHYQILNEPLYTDYALWRGFGYSLSDYLSLLEVAARALHATQPDCRVIGGISANLESGWTRDFVKAGGLRLVDVIDLHMYDPPRPAESFEPSFAALEQLLRDNGGPKPIWMTEWGCYADDDPASIPQSVGDDTMNRCRWTSEREATEHIVKFTAVSFAYGMRKIFFHAGTCGTINGPDAGSVLFEYSGAPRKMYPGVAVLSRLLGVPNKCLGRLNSSGARAFVFQSNAGATAITWAEPDARCSLKLPKSVRALDIMGNRLTARQCTLSSTPVYLVSPSADDLFAAFRSSRRVEDGSTDPRPPQ